MYTKLHLFLARQGILVLSIGRVASQKFGCEFDSP